MKTRILSGLVMLPLLIILVFKGWILYGGCLLLSLMALREFFKGFDQLDIKPSYTIGVISAVILYAVGIGIYFEYDIAMNYGIMLWLFVTVLMCLLYLFSIEKRKLEDAMVTITGIFYVVFFCYHLGALGLGEYGIFVWLVVITAFGTDICAYFAGVCLGKHKLCPKISPKKTWEGAIGGVVGTMILSGLFGHFVIEDMMIHCMIIGLLGSVVSMFGDLTASIFKRKMGIKDYGNLIPGHGGVLDRFDSVLFTGPLVYYYVTVVICAGAL